ncbi:MFS transporter [Gordonia jinhuaensis]|uniref:MFS transporter n=1 Tax=Gordonia jinhuaensis TaxID=1517702 RepID=A0A916X278_9ACTN|nr:MFS transporter [Gordonia jinhuaensis]GGB48251.1 MFS transporter [Gordonia jinhuaensis]
MPATTDGRTAAHDIHYIRNARDVEAIVGDGVDGGSRRSAQFKSLFIMFIALGGVFVDAYDFSSLSVGTVALKHEFGLSATQVGLLSASMAVSALFGALFGGYFVDKIGRKETFILDLWIFVIAAIGCALAPNLGVLIFFRVLMGLGVGLDFPVALSFVVEYCNRKRRGLFVNSSYMNWYLAALVGFGASYLGYLASASDSLWRIAVGFGAVPAVILVLLRRRYMEESPLWLAHQGDLDEAAMVLRKTRNINVIVQADDSSVEPATSGFADTVRELFSTTYRPRAILAAVIGCLQSIEYYAVIFYLPVISGYIFGGGILNAILGGVIFNAIGLVGSATQAWICDRTGLRPLTLYGSLVAAVSLVAVAYAHSRGNVTIEAVALGVFMIGHTMGPGPQGMAFAALSFPTRMRGSAIGWAQGMLRVGSILGFLFFPMMLSAFGFSTTFALLAAAPLGIVAAVMLIRWEPIGRDVDAEDAMSRQESSRSTASVTGH